MDRVSIKERARKQIEGKIFQLLAVYLVVIAISWIISMLFGVLGGLINLFIGGPVAYAFASIYLNINKKSRDPEIEDIFAGFKNNRYSRNLIAYLRYEVFVFLWSLLLVVPGIIKAISYSQMFYLLVEDEKLEAGEAQKKSMEMMEGHKMEYFVLILSFIPWFLLCIITLGIAAIYVTPYYEATMAEFHVRLVKENSPVEKAKKAVKAVAAKTVKTAKTAAAKATKTKTAKTKTTKAKTTKAKTTKTPAKKTTKKSTKK